MFSNFKTYSKSSTTFGLGFLATIYSSPYAVKTAYKDYITAFSAYNSYQSTQYSKEVKYDPYHGLKMLAEIDKYSPVKRLYSMATTTIKSIPNSLICGAFAAYIYIYSDKNILYICPPETAKSINQELTKEETPEKDDAIFSNKDFVMDISLKKLVKAPKKKSTQICACGEEHKYVVDDTTSAKKKIDNSIYQSFYQDPDKQAYASNYIYESENDDDEIDNQYTIKSRPSKKSVNPFIAKNHTPFYQSAWAGRTYKIVKYSMSSSNIRQKSTPIDREPNVLLNQDRQSLYVQNKKDNTGCFENNNAIDGKWEMLDFISESIDLPIVTVN